MNALFLAFLLPAAPLFASDQALVGSWLKDGAPYAELRADGTGRVEGEAVTWKTSGKTLILIDEDGEAERMPYALKGSVLTVTSDGETQTFTRAGAKGGKAAKTAEAPAGKAGGDSLSKLLLSSAWCSFSYNKISGASHQSRVAFRQDGTWSSGARGESYSSGAYGSVAGQTDSGSGGRWKAANGRLMMSEGGGALEDTGLSVSRNSNGYPILKTDGKEYSQCR